MTVSVLVPYRPDGADRDRAWTWLRGWWQREHPDWQVVEGRSSDGLFSRTQAILDAFGRADGDVLVVADADVFCGDIGAAVDQVETVGWAVPHLLLHRLSQTSTQAVLDGAAWRGLPLSADNRQDQRPYRGFETGTLVVLARSVLEQVPPDPRFRGWGHEEEAWSCALRSLVGAPWRGTADLVHLWHPPQPRRSRRMGEAENLALLQRYRRARRDRDWLRALINEGREAVDA